MRSIIRLVAAGALSLPLIIGASGIASADVEFDDHNVSATDNGATVHDLASGADGEGNSYFYESYEVAGPYGAGSYHVLTWTFQGDAGYHDGYAWSSPDGAWVGSTSANAYGDDYEESESDADVVDDLDE
jgi:hypothetical protein